MTNLSELSCLDKFYEDLAKKTINEEPGHVQAHLISFKRWLKSAPHLTVPENDKFLISFLRYAHYEHAVAQRRIDNYCTLRCSSSQPSSQWYNFPELGDPIVSKYLDMGIMIPIGFTKAGVYVILIRLRCWTPDTLTAVEMRTLNNMMFERLIFDERVQVGGICIFIDMAEVNLELARKWSDVKETKSSLKLMQEGSPGRVKHVIFYKESGFFDFAFKLLEVWMSEKMLSRIIKTKDDPKKAFKRVPGLQDVMPIEYGGVNGTVFTCMDKCASEFRTFYSQPHPLKGISVDDSKRPQSAKNYMKEYKDSFNMGTKGTFIQLDPGD